MVMLDIFKADAFSMMELQASIDKVPHLPVGLGQLGIFEPRPIRTTALMVERRQGTLTLVPMSDRGAPGKERVTEKRDARYFETPRLKHEDTIQASELQNIRAFGNETELMQVEDEVARRLSGPTGLLNNIEYTKEFHRLAAVQGQLLDSDGTIKYDWFKEFGLARPAPIAFQVQAALPNTLRPLINGVVRAMARASQGAWAQGITRVGAICDDVFYDALTNHPDVVRTYLNWQAAENLRDNSQGAAFESFDFAGITWINYRGSDDNATLALAAGTCQFFPIGAPGVFIEALGPGESFEWINTPGKPVYVLPIPDRDRNMWWKMEVYSYPLHICTRPEMLISGTA